jgi:nicotinamide-nucleotide amidase
VAGPDGGTPDKPVGTVWLAVAGPGDQAMTTRLLRWPGSRKQIRVLAAHAALALARKVVVSDSVRYQDIADRTVSGHR